MLGPHKIGWMGWGQGRDQFAYQTLIAAVEQADVECGSCGCEFDPLYKEFLAQVRGA